MKEPLEKEKWFMPCLVSPHGGELVDLMVDEDRAEKLREDARNGVSWILTDRQLCDLELLMTGGFSPLNGFMCRYDYRRVCLDMRLADDVLWPIPITLDVTEEVASKLRYTGKSSLFLRDSEGVVLAVLHVMDMWWPDLEREAVEIFGTKDPSHSGVDYLQNHTNPMYLGGEISGIQLPRRYDFVENRLTPARLRRRFAELGWRKVVAFQTRNPMHRAHFEMTHRAIHEHEANLLIHPVVGVTKPGDVDHFTRVRCYQKVLNRYPKNTAMLSLLPLAMRMAGPREALWHAIIRKNYGCSHLVVGRDHAGPGPDLNGVPFYKPYGAQEMVGDYQEELGVEMVPFRSMVYVPDKDVYVPVDEVPQGVKAKTLSGTGLRSRLNEGREIPEWFSFPEVVKELRRTYPPRSKQGFTVFFTGLPSSGKSTLANVVLAKLMEIGGRPMTLLDGDIVRTHLSSELGFSKEHRDINIRRIGFVASEITKNGGIAICAPIAPYDQVRKEVRKMVEDTRGGFVLVHVSTPLDVCEQRDCKGLYARARAGLVKDFTGVSDPYEEPVDAELAIDTSDTRPEECAQEIILLLEREGYIGKEAGDDS